MFWKSSALFFSNKSQKSNNIKLKEGNKVITDNERCADTINSYFNDVAKELKIPVNEDLLENIVDKHDPI